jgi:hypothetical protein
MSLFFTKRGQIDRWYEKAMKELNDNYYNFRDAGGMIDGISASQRANDQLRELDKAKKSLKEEYFQRLKAIGQKPRNDFSRIVDEN